MDIELAQALKEIAELEKQIAELQEKLEGAEKAKEHIENLLYYVKQCTCERSNYAEIEKDIKGAEQFLREVE